VRARLSWLAHGLERPPLVGIGRISYAAYLWHFPIFFPARRTVNEREVRPLKTVLAAVRLDLDGSVRLIAH